MEEADNDVGRLRHGCDTPDLGRVRVADPTGRGYDQRGDSSMVGAVDGDSIRLRGSHGAFLLAGSTGLERYVPEVWDQVDGVDCFI